MAALSLFSIIITYTSLDGFNIGIPLNSAYINPVERWPGPYIKINSFGFFGQRGVYTLTSISSVYAIIYSLVYRSRVYTIMSLILGAQLVNIVYLTGSGRSGFVIIVFLLISLVARQLFTYRTIIFITFSPIMLWTCLYTGIYHDDPQGLILKLNDFMSNRLALYFDSITILTSNPKSLVGWGLNPWDDYTLSEVGVQSSIGTYGTRLTRPHNFFLEFTLQYGSLFGMMFLISLIKIGKKVSCLLKCSKDPTKLATSVVVLGVIFTGLSVGGKMGPFSVEGGSNEFWWIALGYLFGNSYK
jgi:hypothetical protein